MHDPRTRGIPEDIASDPVGGGLDITPDPGDGRAHVQRRPPAAKTTSQFACPRPKRDHDVRSHLLPDQSGPGGTNRRHTLPDVAAASARSRYDAGRRTGSSGVMGMLRGGANRSR